MYDQIVCLSCGEILEPQIRKYREEVAKNKSTGKEILDKLNVNSYCCRTTVLSSVNIGYELPISTSGNS